MDTYDILSDMEVDILSQSAEGTTTLHTTHESSAGDFPLNRPRSTNLWDPRLVLDLAIGVDDQVTILERYGVSEDQFLFLVNTPAFRRDLAVITREVREQGASFKAKAKIQAESYLEELDALVYDEGTPAGVRLDAIKSTVKWADLEPKDSKVEGAVGQAVNIQINF